jgi:ABC-2 type transport system permease protein
LKLSRICSSFVISLKLFFRTRSSLLWVLAFPIIVMLIFGAIFSGNVQYDLAIQNKDGSDVSAAFVQQINSTNVFKIYMISANVNADAYLRSNRMSGMLVIPEGFGKQVQQNLALGAARPAAVVQINSSSTAGINANAVTTTGSSSQSRSFSNETSVTPATLMLKVDQSSTGAPVISGYVNSIVNGFNSKLVGSAEIVGIDQKQVLPPEFRYVDFFVPGIIGMMIITSGVLRTVSMETQNRHKGILRKLGTTPLEKSEWIVSKMLFQTVVVFISTAFIIVTAKLAFDVKILLNAAILPLILAGTVCFTGMGMLIARFVKDADAASVAASVITLPMIFLSGTFIPIETMPDYLQKLANVLPLTYLSEGLRDTMLYGDTAGAMLKMAVVLLIGIIFLIVGSLVTNWRDDDNPMSLKRLADPRAKRAVIAGTVSCVLAVAALTAVVSLTKEPQPEQTALQSDTLNSISKLTSSISLGMPKAAATATPPPTAARQAAATATPPPTAARQAGATATPPPTAAGQPTPSANPSFMLTLGPVTTPTPTQPPA